jgi:hypothetical protein
MNRTRARTEIRTPKLQLDREVVRAMQMHDLGEIVGGTPRLAPTQPSGTPRECCS